MAMLQSARLSLLSGRPVVGYIAWTGGTRKVQLFQASGKSTMSVCVRIRPISLFTTTSRAEQVASSRKVIGGARLGTFV